MTPGPLGSVLAFALAVFLILLIARFVIDLIRQLSRSFQPSGVLIVLFEVVYTATDPPLRALRKVLPPLRLGGVALDLSFLVLIIGVQILRAVALGLPF